MASINGLSVKGIKNFLGHEGEPLSQGNLYLNNTKIGFWSQDSHGGSDNFMLDPQYSERKLNQLVQELNEDKTEIWGPEGKTFEMKYDLERLMDDLLSLDCKEKAFKKARRGGFAGALIGTDGINQVTWKLPKSYMKMDDKEIFEKLAAEIAEAKQNFYPDKHFAKHEFTIYRSADDFHIGEKIDLADIMRKRDLDSVVKDAANKSSQGQIKESAKNDPER